MTALILSIVAGAIVGVIVLLKINTKPLAHPIWIGIAVGLISMIFKPNFTDFVLCIIGSLIGWFIVNILLGTSIIYLFSKLKNISDPD